MENLLFALNIVLPMAILMAMGYIFKKNGFFTDSFISAGKKFCFYCLLSVSLFKNLYDSSLEAIPGRLIIFVVIAILCEFVISFFVAKIISDNRNQNGVIIQGAVRSNYAYIGIPLATMIFSDAELIALTKSEASVLSIFVIPLFNILSVLALVYYSDNDGDEKIVVRTIKNLIKNPCIIAIVCGLLVLGFRALLPGSTFFIRNNLSFIYKVMEYLASMSTPFAFLMVGASLNFSKSISDMKKLVWVVLLRILIFPVVILSVANMTGMFVNVDFAVLVSVFASPTAVSSAIMVSEIGGDEDLANEIVVYTTVFSILGLLLIIFGLRNMGLI